MIRRTCSVRPILLPASSTAPCATALEAAHAAAEAALVEARRRVRLNEERESS
jgi:hypothetical protein